MGMGVGDVCVCWGGRCMFVRLCVCVMGEVGAGRGCCVCRGGKCMYVFFCMYVMVVDVGGRVVCMLGKSVYGFVC